MENLNAKTQKNPTKLRKHKIHKDINNQTEHELKQKQQKNLKNTNVLHKDINKKMNMN